MIRNFILGFLTLFSSASMSIAQLNAEEAKKLQSELEYTRKEAQRFRYLMVAEEIAIRSTQVNDKELAALLALQAFNFNSKQNGYPSNCSIYNGLSSALKNYDLLPKILNSNNQKTYTNGNRKKTDS